MGSDKLPMTKATDSFQVVIIDREQTIACSSDETLLQALIAGGVYLEANCGGLGSCGKCRVQVLRGKVIGPEGLPAVLQADETYLACQISPQEDIVVRVNLGKANDKGLVARMLKTGDQPLLKKVVLKPAGLILENQCSLQEAISQALPTEVAASVDGRFLRQLAAVIATKPELVTVVLVDNEVVAIEAGDTRGVLYGVAFDIGTTTVAGMLVDINAQEMLAACSAANPQAAFGADVITRIKAAADGRGLEKQAAAIRQCLNEIVDQLCALTKISPSHIYAAVIAGNTTMEHLLMEISPVSLIRTPYPAVFQYIEPFSPEQISLRINPHGKTVLLPNIASFIGADTTAAILASGQDVSPRLSLLVDLGTNGEMTIGNRERIFACSTAAGPAFEGAHIRDGMRAAPGAIDDVTIADDVEFRVIGGGRPSGICGSGLVKAVAAMLKSGIITSSGRFTKKEGLPPALLQRLLNRSGKWEFVLAHGEESVSGVEISITQTDIRQLQLAKAAICSGVQILLETVEPKEEIPVLFAGAFGSYIDIDSALAIGLLPKCKRRQVLSVGNAAGLGAAEALLSIEKLERCVAISKRVRHIELATRPDFHATFVRNLTFPEVDDDKKAYGSIGLPDH